MVLICLASDELPQKRTPVIEVWLSPEYVHLGIGVRAGDTKGCGYPGNTVSNDGVVCIHQGLNWWDRDSVESALSVPSNRLECVFVRPSLGADPIVGQTLKRRAKLDPVVWIALGLVIDVSTYEAFLFGHSDTFPLLRRSCSMSLGAVERSELTDPGRSPLWTLVIARTSWPAVANNTLEPSGERPSYQRLTEILARSKRSVKCPQSLASEVLSSTAWQSVVIVELN